MDSLAKGGVAVSVKRKLSSSSGFTLVEVLIAVGLIVILVAIGVLSIVKQRDTLRITELDNKARDIWMAAQNRAVLLQGDGRMGEQLADGGAMQPYEDKYFAQWGSSGSDAIVEELVPVGSIDPTCRSKGQCYVVYDLAAGCVTDVFYVESDLLMPDIDSAFKLAKAGVNARKKNIPMVGYYGSEGDPGDNITTRPLPSADVSVRIDNGDELVLTVTFTVPSDLPSGVVYTPSVRLQYGDYDKTLLSSDSGIVECWGEGSRLIASDHQAFTDLWFNDSVTYTWVLDSLADESKQFKTLGVGDPGKKFSVVAGIRLSADGYIDSTSYAEASDNSLFAKSSSDSVAKIENLRHLQNLHQAFSGVVSSVIGAEQLLDIDCKASFYLDGTVINDSYEFIPVVNENLVSYDGRRHEITRLTTLKVVDAGLFGSFTGDITGVRLVDTTATGSSTAGALVGKSTDTNISDCHVYWSEVTVLDNLVNNGLVVCKVLAPAAGGLVGDLSGGSVKSSFAATTVSGDKLAGGLAGQMRDTGISGCYSDCYITGGTVGGLFGTARGSVKTCYAAGFIVANGKEIKSAGLSHGTVSFKDSYSAVRFMGLSDKNIVFTEPDVLLCASISADSDSSAGVYYIYKAVDAPTISGFSVNNRGSFVETHPYDIAYTLDNSLKSLRGIAYPYPYLSDLPHWCDWVDLERQDTFAIGDIAYIERYDNDEYGLYYSRANTLRDDELIYWDKYALVLNKDRVVNAKDGIYMVYGPNGETWALRETSQQHTSIKVGDVGAWEWINVTEGKSWSTVRTIKYGDDVLFIFEDSLLTGSPADSNNFWQSLTLGIDDNKVMWFNPHFAKATAESTTGSDVRPPEPLVGSWSISIRTPRQVKNIGSFPDAYCANRFSYSQEFDIDFHKTDPAGYEWYGRDNPVVYVGGAYRTYTNSGDAPFSGVYEGNYHILTGVFSTGDGIHNSGMFGGVSETGELRNIMYGFGPELINDTLSPGVGVLVGNNAGRIYNCAIYGINVTAGYGTNVMGGLVCENTGIIENCSVEVLDFGGQSVQITSGIAGISSGQIKNSYVVGKISGYNSSFLYGLSNGGDTTGSYSMLYLSGGVMRTGAGGVGGTYAVGTFRYRNDVFDTASMGYVDPECGVNWTKLQRWDSTTWTRSVLDLVGQWNFNYFYDVSKRSFSYTPVVKDADGTYIHYGLWPIPITSGLVYFEHYNRYGVLADACIGFDAVGRQIGGSLLPPEYYEDPVAEITRGYAVAIRYDYGEGEELNEPRLDAGFYHTVQYGSDVLTLYATNWGGQWFRNGEQPVYVSAKSVKNADGTGYYLYDIPTEVLAGVVPDPSSYYQTLRVGGDMYLFNPNVAASVYPGN